MNQHIALIILAVAALSDAAAQPVPSQPPQITPQRSVAPGPADGMSGPRPGVPRAGPNGDPNFPGAAQQGMPPPQQPIRGPAGAAPSAQGFPTAPPIPPQPLAPGVAPSAAANPFMKPPVAGAPPRPAAGVVPFTPSMPGAPVVLVEPPDEEVPSMRVGRVNGQYIYRGHNTYVFEEVGKKPIKRKAVNGTPGQTFTAGPSATGGGGGVATAAAGGAVGTRAPATGATPGAPGAPPPGAARPNPPPGGPGAPPTPGQAQPPRPAPPVPAPGANAPR